MYSLYDNSLAETPQIKSTVGWIFCQYGSTALDDIVRLIFANLLRIERQVLQSNYRREIESLKRVWMKSFFILESHEIRSYFFYKQRKQNHDHSILICEVGLVSSLKVWRQRW